MADPIAFGLTDDNGAPHTAATPTFLLFCDRTGAARTPPTAPAHQGLGRYMFEPSADDEATGCCFVIDCGAGATSGGGRYLAGTVPEATTFECWVLTDQSGSLWTGAAPTFPAGGYEDRNGGALTPPIITSLGSGAFTFTPAFADAAAGVSYRVDSPAGAIPELLYGSAIVLGTAPPEVTPGISTYPADAVAQMLAGTIALSDPPGGGTVTLDYSPGGNLLVGPVRSVSSGVETLAVFVLQSGGF